MTDHAASHTGRASPRLAPPLTRQRIVLRLTMIVALGCTVWAWRRIDMSPFSLLAGLGDMGSLLGRMVPPRFADAGDAVELSIETLWMALIGTALATVTSVPLAFGAARNTTPHWTVQKLCRAVIVATRAIPDLVFAVILVRVFSIGILPGVLALGLHSIGMVGKLFADAIEHIDETPREAVVSVGARKWSAIASAVLPQVLPSFVGTAMYRLDINLRTATVLGFVGAGGIGQLLKTLLGQLQYSRALGVVIVLVVFVIGVELFATAVRKNLIGDADRPGGRHRGRRPGSQRVVTSGRAALTPPWTPERIRTTTLLVLLSALLVAAMVLTRINPWEIVAGVPDMWSTASRMMPPDFTTARSELISGMTETVAIGVVGAAIGFAAALPIGLLAARNVSPNRTVYAATRFALVVVRAVPDLIVVVIFVAAMGLGPTPGVIALSISTATFMARLVADAVEEVDPHPREAVIAIGATRLQETFTSVLPQAMPAIVAHLLYTFDVNIRASTIVGMTGAGGIGFLLQNSVRVLHWQTTVAIVLSIFALVYAIELLAGWIRRQIQ